MIAATTQPAPLLEVAADLGLDLGEGPIWDDAAQTLLFVDSTAGAIFRFDPGTGAVTRTLAGPEIGAAIPRVGGGLAVSSQDGILAVEESTGGTSLLAPIERDRASRLNDAKCDSRGRMFSGSFAIPFARNANALYRIDPDLTVTRVVDDVTVSNGLGWSPDEATFYYIDTSARGIDRFDYDIASGALSNRRRFADIDPAEGFPDGMAVDSRGHVWVALYLGGAVRRYTPDGEIVEQLTLPVSGVTSCNFGGPGLTDLYITTARYGVPEERLAYEPLAGALFRYRQGVAGLPSHRFAG